MKLLSMLLFGIALACSNSGSNDGYVTESKAYEPGYGIEQDLDVLEESVVVSNTPSFEIQEQKIIKTARLAYETQDVEATHNRVLQLTNEYEGFVQSDNSGKSYNRLFRNMVIRIPTEKFQNFIDMVSEGVSYFDQKDISRKDVSEEFVDIEARLKAKRELEKALFRTTGSGQKCERNVGN